MGLERLLTIGVYGFDREAFTHALERAAVDVLCDIRARRGVRGREYSWANSVSLQATLGEIGIGYVHLRALAPSELTRAAQHEADRSAGVTKRQRDELSDVFRASYAAQLTDRDAREALSVVVSAGRNPALLCVERAPRACHRSLVADEIRRLSGVPVEHLQP